MNKHVSDDPRARLHKVNPLGLMGWMIRPQLRGLPVWPTGQNSRPGPQRPGLDLDRGESLRLRPPWCHSKRPLLSRIPQRWRPPMLRNIHRPASGGCWGGGLQGLQRQLPGEPFAANYPPKRQTALWSTNQYWPGNRGVETIKKRVATFAAL